MPTLKYRDPADGLWKPVDGFVQPHPQAMLTMSGSQTIATGSVTGVVLDTVGYDTGGMTELNWSLAAGRIIAPLSGYYRIFASASFASNATGYRAIVVRKNGTAAQAGGTLVGHQYMQAANGQITGLILATEPQWMNQGDYITLNVVHTAGVDLNLNMANNRNAILAMEYAGLVGPGGVVGASVTSLVATTDVSVAGGSLPRGSEGYAALTSTFGTTSASTTVVDVTSLAVTFTAVAGRRYKVSASWNNVGTVVNDRVAVVIREGTTQIQGQNFVMPLATTLGFSMSVVVTPTAGAHTYTLGFYRGAGTGTISLLGSATAPAFLLVEDIGT